MKHLLLSSLLSSVLAMPSPPCPQNPTMECGEGMMNCPGPVDFQGCTMPDTCVAFGEECPFYCAYLPPMDCGEGWMSCPGPVDSMGCQMGGTCVAYGDECPYNCPHVPFNDCPAQGMQNCPGPMDPMGCMTADTCVPLEEMCPFLLSPCASNGLRRRVDELPWTC